jgi:hypothetical protein
MPERISPPFDDYLLPDEPTAGVGSVAWGPDFGGVNGDQLGVAAAVTLPNIEAAYEPVTVQGSATLTEVRGNYEPVTEVATITELRYDTAYLAGATTAANDGPDAWTSPNNAVGARGVAGEASRVGQAVAATDANLRLNYADFGGGLETFTITAVSLRYDTRQTGTLLNNGGLHHEYRLVAAGAWTSLAVFTADVDNNPTSYDITADVGGDWSKLSALEVRVRAVLAVGTAAVTCFCDSVEVSVTANKVVTP